MGLFHDVIIHPWDKSYQRRRVGICKLCTQRYEHRTNGDDFYIYTMKIRNKMKRTVLLSIFVGLLAMGILLLAGTAYFWLWRTDIPIYAKLMISSILPILVGAIGWQAVDENVK